MFLSIKPYKDPLANTWEVFNEVCVISVSYILLTLNDPSTDQEMREAAGGIYVGICLFNFTINAAKMVKNMMFESIP
jgi:hypothetical protein